jgi:hypothetical protein
MASPEAAIATALGNNFEPGQILAWTNDPNTGQLQLVCDSSGLVSENITVAVIDVH